VSAENIEDVSGLKNRFQRERPCKNLGEVRSLVHELNIASASKRNFVILAATKLRSSSMSLHGVFHKSRFFDPTCLYEAKAKPMIQQKCLFGSYVVNYADVEYIYRTP
jgi:hypothetical protein